MSPYRSIYFERNFDREADFIAGKKFWVGAELILPGQDFDKELVSTRLLRQLFEQRYLIFKNGDRRAAPPGRPLKSIREEAENLSRKVGEAHTPSERVGEAHTPSERAGEAHTPSGRAGEAHTLDDDESMEEILRLEAGLPKTRHAERKRR